MPPELQAANSRGMGRELFTNLRKHALKAEEGACTWL
jgi:phosphogluconate dehydratase